MKLLLALATIITSSNAYSHTGIHTEHFHPLSGIDHFTVILVIALISGIAYYYQKK